MWTYEDQGPQGLKFEMKWHHIEKSHPTCLSISVYKVNIFR